MGGPIILFSYYFVLLAASLAHIFASFSAVNHASIILKLCDLLCHVYSRFMLDLVHTKDY